MNCLTPDVNVPPAFSNWDNELKKDRQRRSAHSTSVLMKSYSQGKGDTSDKLIAASTSNRFPRAFQKPSSAAIKVEEAHVLHRVTRTVQDKSDFTIITSDETLDFYLGFKLDGVTSYKNLSDTKDMFDYSKMTYFVTEPEIFINEFEPFIPYSGMTINIKVCVLNFLLYELNHWIISLDTLLVNFFRQVILLTC